MPKLRDIETPNDLRSEEFTKTQKSQDYYKAYYDNKYKDPLKYQAGDYVMVNNFDTTVGAPRKLIPRFKGPYVVIKVLRNDRYMVYKTSRISS